ncbi:heavy metal-associated domain-containing protein, partial [Allocoleopsis sp.]|uniref:heavy metal-associated domain-containing protein n=1 Tax=Allocoleopsis sp. TaxID=3088169 RepID=UPI002FD5BAC2
METLTLKLQGMSCASCAKNVEEAIQAVPGVSECVVNFGMEQATVKYEPQKTNLETIQDAVSEAGYSAESLQAQEMITGEGEAQKDARLAESRALMHKVVTGGIISVLLVVGS